METNIVFFDDICVLCSRSVQFIYRHDRLGRFSFASLESQAYRQIEHLVPGNMKQGDSVILYMDGKVYHRSAAAFHIVSRLRFPVSLLAAGFIIPGFIRDRIYDWIAENRYRWFGKRESCFTPQGDLRKRYLK